VVKKNTKLFIALPVLNEFDYIHEFIHCLEQQTFTNFEIYICVNQPDDWWDNPQKRYICFDNQKTLLFLENLKQFPIKIIDRSTKDKGWKGKHYGVGWARKTVMDAIDKVALDDDIIVSIDADTTFTGNYFEAIFESIRRKPEKVALSIPYYHKLTENETIDRLILRYEIYMRYYALNMWRINNPYKFTAIGSAIGLPVKSYRKVGGITPHKSGEDFYFLQKLSKIGEINQWCEEKIYPAARFSDRVIFGTGPAMIKGKAGDWSSYPIYNYHNFDKVKDTYIKFNELYEKDIKTPMDGFLREIFNEINLWDPLRRNYKTREHFALACQHKVDGLRILQFLKSEQKKVIEKDEDNLLGFLTNFYHENLKSNKIDVDRLDFDTSSIDFLNRIRDLLEKIEDIYRRNE
jgi:hypothetical protein